MGKFRAKRDVIVYHGKLAFFYDFTVINHVVVDPVVGKILKISALLSIS